MNCLECQRALVTEPNNRRANIERHLASCGTCSRTAAALARLDRDIADAASVPLPDALPERILLVRRGRALPQYARAAAIVLGSALTALAAVQLVGPSFVTERVEAVGPAHPAITAIGEVSEDALRPVLSTAEGADNLERVLKRLGLTLKPGTSMQYVGKCYVATTDCDHIVVSTPDGQGNIMLVSDYAFDSRLIVTDRHMTALVQPVGQGGYIVVADTPKTARQMAKLLVKS